MIRVLPDDFREECSVGLFIINHPSSGSCQSIGLTEHCLTEHWPDRAGANELSDGREETLNGEGSYVISGSTQRGLETGRVV